MSHGASPSSSGFNVALNGLSQKVSGIYEGNLYQALPPESGPFDETGLSNSTVLVSLRCDNEGF